MANFEGIRNLIVTDEEIQAERELFKNALQTGFQNVNENAPFVPGVYLLGALPGMGKTTLALNIAANICESGVPVLYVSYEQSIMNFWFKDLARFYFLQKYNNKNAGGAHDTPSALDLRRGKISDADLKNFEKYRNELNSKRDNFYFMRGHGETAKQLQVLIREYVKKVGVKFVVIDYLQRIQGENVKGNATMREQVDKAIFSLKDFQEEIGITLLLISNFNRQNYNSSVSLESFKESGGIEYTADVVFGLQFKCPKGTTRNSDFYEAEMKKYPRLLELVCVKNRYGKNYFKVNLSYFSKGETFFDCGEAKEENSAQKSQATTDDFADDFEDA